MNQHLSQNEHVTYTLLTEIELTLLAIFKAREEI